MPAPNPLAPLMPAIYLLAILAALSQALPFILPRRSRRRGPRQRRGDTGPTPEAKALGVGCLALILIIVILNVLAAALYVAANHPVVVLGGITAIAVALYVRYRRQDEATHRPWTPEELPKNDPASIRARRERADAARAAAATTSAKPPAPPTSRRARTEVYISPSPTFKPEAWRDKVYRKIEEIDWFQFEKVTEIVLRSQGYDVRRFGGANPDGGVDMIAARNGVRTAVQCKQRRNQRIGVAVARELVGAMHDRKIEKGMIVCSHDLTTEAEEFARRNGLRVMASAEIRCAIVELQGSDRAAVDAIFDDPGKVCPKCGSEMVMREPQHGENWNPFWGCKRYPKCRQQMAA